MRPSSISSSDISCSDSDPESDYQSLDQANRLRVALKTLAAGVLVFGAVVLIYNGILQALGDINGRVVAQLEHLPGIVAQNRDKRKVFVFGSSMVQAGFEPDVFDAAMADKGIDTISYNYGVGNLDPEFQVLIARRIREAFLEGDEQLALTLIEFNPFQATRVRNRLGAITRDQNVAVLSSNEELWNITLDDPTRGLRLFNIRYLRSGLSAELITSIPRMFASAGSAEARERRAQIVATEEYQAAQERSAELSARYRELRDTNVPITGSDQWKAEIRGGRIDKSAFSPETLEALGAWMESRRYPGFMEVDLMRRVAGADILELEFEEALIEAFIELVIELDDVSDQIEVILLPRNTEWVTYTPEVQERLNGVLRRIADETGVAVRDFQEHPAITPQYFFDTTHLSTYDGIDIFSRLLADEYADVLSQE